MPFKWTDAKVKKFARLYTGAGDDVWSYRGLNIEKKLAKFKRNNK